MTYKGSVGKSLVNQHTFDHPSELKGLCLMKLPSELPGHISKNKAFEAFH